MGQTGLEQECPIELVENSELSDPFVRVRAFWFKTGERYIDESSNILEPLRQFGCG